MKMITFAIPCYNSEAYMEHCVESLLPGGEDVEIIIVDDGSADGTAKIADRYEAQYPGIVRAVHQENGGHGEAVNTGLKNATGFYFKVVDSDDWLDTPGLLKMLGTLKSLYDKKTAPDLIVCNYVYEHTEDNTRHYVRFTNVFPQNRVFSWSDIGIFKPSQYLMMHSIIYRTEVLRESGLALPKHTFYVDNLFSYQPLPYVKTLYYMNINLYRYFIGRADQSVNEQIMIRRIDQQLRVNTLMIDCYRLPQDIPDRKLAHYMISYLRMMMTISSVFLQISGTEENLKKKEELWTYLKNRDKKLYYQLRFSIFGTVANLPGKEGRKITARLYRFVRKLYKFN